MLKFLFILFAIFRPGVLRAHDCAGYGEAPGAARRRDPHLAMFSALRIVTIVGVIFYLSPVRDLGDGPALRDAARRVSRPDTPRPSTDSAAHLDSLWKLLPDSAKDAVLERILTSALGPAPSTSMP